MSKALRVGRGEGAAAARAMRAASLALLMAGACATPLWAQTAAQSAPPPNPGSPGQGGAPAAQTPSAQVPQSTPSGPAGRDAAPASRARPRATAQPDESDSDDDDATTVKEVVVNGHRTQVGAVVGDIKPEIQLTPADIQSFGVSTVTELLGELGPEVRSDRGRGSGPPVVLLNGRRISSFNEIRNIPTEAILRVDILPEEVSLKYGYTADQRVVNIVLRRRFHAWTGELKGGGPTEGGQVEGQAEGDLLRLHGDNRLNVDLQYQGNSDLTEAARGIQPSSGQSAGAPTPADLGQDRTLLPASQTVTLNGVLAHSTLGGIGLTLNGTLSTNESDGLQGLPSAALSLPAANPFNTSGQAQTVGRYVSGLGPLTQVTNGWTGHLGLTANKDAYGWRFSLTGAYDHSDSLTATETGLAPNSAAQQQLTALSPTLNPYGPLPARLFTRAADDTGRAISELGNAQFLANGPLAHLPAGDFYASLKFGDTIQGFWSRTDRGGLASNGFLWRNTLNAQANLDLPVLKHTFDKGWGLLGDLSLNGNVAVDQLSDFGTLLTLGYGINWTPWRPVNLIVSRTIDHLAPTVQQLGNPLVVTPNVPVYDDLTGQTVLATTLSGGNPYLKADSRQVTKVGLTIRPWEEKQFSFTANYIWSDIKNSPFAVPGSASPQIEQDFPQAYVRNAQGELVEVNETAQNLADQSREELRWGFNFATPIGPPPKSDPNAPRPPWRGQAGSGGAGAGATGGHEGGGNGGHGGGDRWRSRGGGRGGGFGGYRGAQQGRLQVALYHTVYFRDQVLAQTGYPALDLLNGGATGSSGGQYRQEIEGQLGYTKSGLGIRFSADWKSATRVEGGAAPEDLAFSQIGTVNLRVWDSFSGQPKLVRAHRWLRGARVTLEVTNLFDTRQTVHDGLGATPAAYLPGYINPAGRVIVLHLRKLFF